MCTEVHACVVVLWRLLYRRIILLICNDTVLIQLKLVSSKPVVIHLETLLGTDAIHDPSQSHHLDNITEFRAGAVLDLIETVWDYVGDLIDEHR